MERLKTVLVVDDDEDDRMLIRDALENIIDSVNIVEIENGKDLLDQVVERSGQQEISLIILDMNMPLMNGVEALSHIKCNPGLVHIPVVMVSTTANQALILQAYDRGINAFITKPISIQQYEDVAKAINICFLNNYYPASSKNRLSRDFKGKNILVIEDNDDHWRIMEQGLKQSLPNVVVSRTDGKENLVSFLENTVDPSALPELIFLDLYLPTRKEGLDLIAYMRDFYISRKVPAAVVIVFSSSSNQHDIRESYAQGANAYLVKSQDLSMSISYFKDLCHFWWDTIVLPKKHSHG